MHRYSGSLNKGQLEALFTKYVSKSTEAEIDGESINNLQRVLGIKDAVADRIAQVIHEM